jgi:hypothetical protein
MIPSGSGSEIDAATGAKMPAFFSSIQDRKH